jgi:hypothetical protein
MLTDKTRFRWAACQLEILRRQGSPRQIHEALEDLPETVEKIYERILISIPQSLRHICIRALHLVQAPVVTFKIEELAEAAIIDNDRCAFSTNDRLIDPSYLLEACICLLRVNSEHHVILAHYTVAEHLRSRRILDTPASEFHLKTAQVSYQFSKTCAIYLHSIGLEKLPAAGFPFMRIAGARWNYFFSVTRKNPTEREYKFDKNRSLTNLVLQLAEKRMLGLPDFGAPASKYHFMSSDRPVTFSHMLAYLWCHTSNNVGEEFLRRHAGEDDLNLDDVVSVRHYRLVFRLHILQLAMVIRSMEGFRLLIQSGANPNFNIKPFGILGNYLALSRGIRSPRSGFDVAGKPEPESEYQF